MSESRPLAPFARVAIIGVGLMGGSLALALRAAGLARHVVGYSATHASLEAALQQGLIDEAAPSAALAATNSDLVVLAVPVGAMAASFAEIAPVLRSDSLLLDVGSTKHDVIAAAREHLGARLANFVPCHPIAGKEKAGAARAQATLYQARQTIITPLPENSSSTLEMACAVWRAVGSQVAQMSAERHDTVFAAVSHLPHLLAFAYINGLLSQEHGDQLLAWGGPGFRDFSRIAGSSPSMWHDVLLANRDAVLSQSRAFRQALEQLEHSLQNQASTELTAHLTRASRARSDWSLHTQVDSPR